MPDVYTYKDADTSVLYHDNDPALRPIRLSLPRPPRLKKIDGYGLDPRDQKFQRHQLPPKLKNLEEMASKDVHEWSAKKGHAPTLFRIQRKFWELLDANKEYYSSDIDWIRRTWWHIINGYWFFNNGKPTYITGWHYFYLNFWFITGVGRPQYRDRDRKEFLFFHYAYTTKETFTRYDKDNVAVPEDDGSYKMTEMPYRTCFGVGQNKNRRSGNTNKGLSIVYLMTSTHKGTDGGGIMSMSGDNADAHFEKKLLPAWRKMPLFSRPYTSSSNSPSSIENQAPANSFDCDSLENAITSADTAQSTFYDGKKLWAILVDESGKAVSVDVRERHNVIKHCLAQGNGSIIHGFEYQPSTAEDLGKGGKAYKLLLQDSFFYKRDPVSGQTPSGLFRLFIGADESLDGFIDEYGIAVKGKEVSPEYRGKYPHTATQFLESKRSRFLIESKTNPEAMLSYRAEKRLFPIFYDDSWTGEAGEIGFDINIIDRRLAELSRGEMTLRGNFEWSGVPFKSPVIWVTDSTGRWDISMLLDSHESNQKIMDYMYDDVAGQETVIYRPTYPDRFTMGVDPFRFKTTAQARLGNAQVSYSKNRMSDGGIGIFYHRDYKIDPENKPISEWESNRFVATYRYRPPIDDEFAMDTLKACVYYGAMCFPEMNIDLIWKKFHDWGFDGYLKYQVDINGRVKDKPGITATEGNKQLGFTAFRNYISLHGHRERHTDLLYEAKNIDAMESLTKFDLLAASMWALIGSQSGYSRMLAETDEIDYDISEVIGL